MLLLPDDDAQTLQQLRQVLTAIDPALGFAPALPSIEEVFAGMIRQRQEVHG